jgi:FAD/FMN-containing dehydrogenase
MEAPSSPSCTQIFKELKNPYYLGDEIGLTQSLGWVDAWTSRPSVYAVAAETTDDVVAAVNFARENNLRLVVKGGGHSYQGTSNAADSLLIWTRRMNAITLHDAFVGSGCGGQHAPQEAVTVESGAIWGQVYDAVTTKGGRYVQGGGCTTVGVAGLIQCGGFGSFSKAYGMAAGSLLEAQIVTADGSGQDRQRLHESRPVLGDQGGRRREPWCRNPAHAADAQSAGILRRRVRHHQGNVEGRLPPADRQGHRILQQVPV